MEFGWCKVGYAGKGFFDQDISITSAVPNPTHFPNIAGPFHFLPFLICPCHIYFTTCKPLLFCVGVPCNKNGTCVMLTICAQNYVKIIHHAPSLQVSAPFFSSVPEDASTIRPLAPMLSSMSFYIIMVSKINLYTCICVWHDLDTLCGAKGKDMMRKEPIVLGSCKYN